MTKCPYCGGKINTAKELPPLSPREFKVYNVLLNNGRQYTKVNDLKAAVFGAPEEGSDTSIRVTVHYMNKILAKSKQKISCHRKVGYRLEEL